jgi:chromosome segregation ATPase
MDKKMNEFVS